MGKGRARIACAAMIVIVTSCIQGVPARATPAGLPAHLGIGISAGPDANGLTGWMPDSSIPFDYAYQYLAAGVNTGQGWQTWNDSAQFPLWYAQSAASHGYIPVFPYYMLLQSTGACDSCDEAQKDLSHLNDASLMHDYYGDFAMLMKRLGTGTYDGIAGFGGTAIVHVEPDLSGYAEQAVLSSANCFGFCTGGANDPANLRASVASSGYAAVSAYADTYQGFNRALIHLRDLYAPNVLLAFHLSGWASDFDVDQNTDPTLDVAALGRQVASFAMASGLGSGYDLAFNDVADRDAGYYKQVYNFPGAWWDRTNGTLPNFHQWEQYVTAIDGATGVPMFVWQIPLGNQYYATEDNVTDGHYQDNRVEYFFAHMDELRAAGIVGLLFGAGNAGSTVNFDGTGDGVTNPPSTCTTDGTSGAAICNSHTSTSSDDDGGYFREQAAAYYQSPVAIGPWISGARASASAFSPNGDHVRDATTLSFTLNAAATTTVVVVDRNGAVARTILDAVARAPGSVAVTWNGMRDDASRAPDGRYAFRIDATSPDGSAPQVRVPVLVDTRAPSRPVVSSPSGATTVHASSYTLRGTAERASVLRIWRDLDRDGSIDRGEHLAASLRVPSTGRWSAPVWLARGRNRFILTATDAAGNVSATAPTHTIARG